MQRHTGRLVPALLVGALLALGQGGITAAASPTAPEPSAAQRTPSTQGTLNVSPPLISLAVEPGGTATAELTLHAGLAQNVTIQADGLDQALDGSFKGLPSAQDKSPFSARPMMTLTPQTFQIEAGGSQTVTVTVTAPKDAGEGTRYAILDITGVPVTSQNVGIAVRLGVSSLVTLSNTKQLHTGQIQGLTVGKVVPGQPMAATGTLVNTGNAHFGAAPNQVVTTGTVWDSNDQVVATGKSVLSGNSIVPSFGRQFSMPLNAGQALSDGHYRLEVDAGLQDGTILDRVSIDFDVSAGSVLGATNVPNQGPPASAGAHSDNSGMLMALLAALLLAGMGIGAIVLSSRRTRRRRIRG